MPRQKQLISRVKKCFTNEVDQPSQKSKRKGIVEVTKARTLQRKDSAVTESEKKFPGVCEEEDNCRK